MNHPMIIGGSRVGEGSGGRIIVLNPATDQPVGTVPRGGPPEAAAAVDAADSAAVEWRRLPASQRGLLLRRVAESMLQQESRLADLLTAEQGKPVHESRAEIATAAAYFRDASEEATRVFGDIGESPQAGKRMLVLRQPVGIVGAITPWNFPAVIAARKVAPALAVGCTVVLKPASRTPLTALALTALALEAGVPPGVLNVVTGDAASIAATWLGDARVRQLSFTGSTQVGKRLIALSAEHVTRLTLELGGLASFIVFDDADLAAAVEGVIASKFRNAGQTCICANRVLVQEGIADRFREAVAQRVAALRVGVGTDERTDIGPLIDDRAMDKVERHVANAVAGGARILVGGTRVRPAPAAADRFYAPTFLDRVTGEMDISREETFGPVLPLTLFRTEHDAISAANDTPYGLAAYFYTSDATRLLRVSEALECGIIGANDGAPSSAGVPLGGMRESGLGVEGGRWGIEDYLVLKYVSWGGFG